MKEPMVLVIRLNSREPSIKLVSEICIYLYTFMPEQESYIFVMTSLKKVAILCRIIGIYTYCEFERLNMCGRQSCVEFRNKKSNIRRVKRGVPGWYIRKCLASLWHRGNNICGYCTLMTSGPIIDGIFSLRRWNFYLKGISVTKSKTTPHEQRG